LKLRLKIIFDEVELQIGHLSLEIIPFFIVISIISINGFGLYIRAGLREEVLSTRGERTGASYKGSSLHVTPPDAKPVL
ncbi:MAG: hypothetical protein WBH98_08860, partial [Bacteroidales bacterium]